MNTTFQCIPFSDFCVEDLYEVLQLRQKVFVVEQDCPYLDADGNDQKAFHVLGYDERRTLIAYSRFFAPGLIYDHYAAIGRVVTEPKIRGRGIGYLLMEESIRLLEEHFGSTRIKISAQYHLMPFYQKLGFCPVGEQYLEDGIPHIGMVR